jgi:hypothetical protein
MLMFSQQKCFSSLSSIYCTEHDIVEVPQLKVNNEGQAEAKKLFA